MSAGNENSLTGFGISSTLASYQQLSGLSSDLVKGINQNFSMIKIDTKPFEAAQAAMGKLSVVTQTIDFAKASLDVAKFTTGIIANTMSTNVNTAAKNSQMIAEAKEIGLYVQVIAATIKDTVQTGLHTAAVKAHTLAVNSGILVKVKEIALYVQTAALKAKDIIQTGLSTAAQVAHAVALKALTVIQALVNLLMNMSPIGIIIVGIVLVVAAVALVVAAVVAFWNKSVAFREFITGMLNGIVKFVQSSVAAISSFFSGLWNSIVAIFTPVGNWFSGVFNGAWNGIRNAFASVAGFFSGLWGSIVAIFTPVGNWFSGVFNGAWNGIRNAFAGVASFFSGLWGSIVGVFSSIGSAIGNAVGGAFKSVVNSILDFAQNTINGFFKDINGAIGVVNRIPGVHIPAIPSLSLPRLALGGVIDTPTIAMVGEAGREAVVPLENTGFVAAIGAAVGKAVSAALSSSAVGNGNTGDVGVTLQIDREVLGRATVRAINNQIRRTGAIPLNI